MDFLKTIAGLKKNPLEMKNALDHVANYDKERNKNDFYTSTLLSENEHSFLYVKHVEIKEIISSIMGFDYDKYKFLHSIANIRRLGDEIIKSTEKSIKDIPEELPESVREELKQSMELQIEKYRTPLTLYESGAQAICDDVNHILELFRRTYVSGDVAICGQWSGLDTLVDARVFLMWARENGFHIPEEVSCLLPGPTATTPTTEPDHDQQMDGYSRPLPGDKITDFIQRLRDKKVHPDEIQYRTYEYGLPEWDVTQWQVNCLVRNKAYPPEGLMGEVERNNHGKAYGRAKLRYLARVETSEKSEKVPEQSEFMA